MRAVQLSIWAGNARRRPLDPVVRDIPARARVSLSESWFVRQELPASARSDCTHFRFDVAITALGSASADKK